MKRSVGIVRLSEATTVSAWSSSGTAIAEDVWDALEHMTELKVPEKAQCALLGENARKLYGIDPVLKVTERIAT